MDAYNLTRDGLIAGLTPVARKSTLLLDVYRAMQAAGDSEAERFKRTACREFGHKLMATVGGAEWAMSQWIEKHTATNEIMQANRIWFLNVLKRVGCEVKAAA